MRLPQFVSAMAERVRWQRRPLSKPAKYALRGLGVVAVLVIVVAAALVAVVLSGPTEVGFIRERAQAALQKGLGRNYKATVDKAVIDVDPVLGLVVEIDGITVRDSENTVVVQAPSTRLAVDPMALLGFHVEVTNIEVSRPQVAIVRSDKGEVYLGNANTAHAAERRRAIPPPNVIAAAGSDGGFPDLVAAMQILDRGLEPSIDAALRAGFLHFSLVDGSIEIWDAERLRQRRFPDTDLSVTVDPATGNATANFASSGYGGRWTATLDRDIDQASGQRTLSAVFSQLTVADLFPALGEDDPGGVSADIPLYGRATAHIAADGSVEDAAVRLDLGAGTFRFGENHETVLLDEASIRLHWDVANKVVVLDPSSVSFGRTQGVLTGWARPEGDPKERRYSFQIEAPGMILAPKDATDAPMVADRLGMEGSIDLAAQQITLDNAVVQSNGAGLTAAGSIGYGHGGVTAIAASVSPMSVATLKHIWIPFIAPGARHWVMEHILSGQISEGKFTAAVPSSMVFARQPDTMTDDQLHLALRLEDVAFSSYGDLPVVRHASGNLVLAGGTFGVDVDGAVVPVSSGTVNITAGAFAIGNVFARPSEGNIAMQLTGDAQAIGEIADAKPLQTLANRQITPADLSGKADVSVSLNMPLIRNVTDADVDWRVSVKATDLASKAPVEGRIFSDANVTIGVTPDDVTIVGKAKIDGVLADVSMTQPVGRAGVAAGAGARYVRVSLDEAARKRLGIGLDDILGGTVGATISSAKDGGKGEHYDLDLKRARLVVPGLGWSKGVGIAAALSFDMRPADDGGYAVENIEMTGAGFGFTGSAELDSGYGLVSANIDKFALRPGDSLGFTLGRTKTGYTIAARGASFDLRGFFTYLKGGAGSGGSAPDLTIDARIDKVTGFNQEVITGGKLSLLSVGGDARKIVFNGSIGGGDVSLNYADSGANASLTMHSSDAGRVLRFVDIYPRAQGGSVDITAVRNGSDGPLAGTFDIDNFDITDEPALQKLIETPPDPGGGGPKLDPGRVHIVRLFADFHQGGRSLTIDDGILRGTTVGATFNGRFDFDASRMTINGTYLPAYNVNNAFSRVPLIGMVLTGGAAEGLIGVTFRIDGQIDSPRVFFNPLSAVAPGIFRKIFEFH